MVSKLNNYTLQEGEGSVFRELKAGSKAAAAVEKRKKKVSVVKPPFVGVAKSAKRLTHSCSRASLKMRLRFARRRSLLGCHSPAASVAAEAAI